MSTNIDQATAIRQGEELPLDRLKTYLQEHLPEFAGPLTVKQFPQGHSNLTYLLRVGEAELVLRRPPFGNKVKTAHDMGREFRVLSKLSAVYAAAPRPYVYCADESVLGDPFYIMERRHGVILRHPLPPGIAIDPATAHRLSASFIDNLAQLHSLDYQAAGLGDLGKPQGYVGRQMSGWIGRYEQARTDTIGELEHVATWLAGNQPEEVGAALIHNDYKYDNLVFDPRDLEPARLTWPKVVAVLDWEMATVGDPLMDLGTTLGYWVEAGDTEAMQRFATGPTMLPGSLTRQELAGLYLEKTGRPPTDVLFYYCYGLFKIAVIVQQIYARYVRGHTRDVRFARLNEFVLAVSQQAARALAVGKV